VVMIRKALGAVTVKAGPAGEVAALFVAFGRLDADGQAEGLSTPTVT